MLPAAASLRSLTLRGLRLTNVLEQLGRASSLLYSTDGTLLSSGSPQSSTRGRASSLLRLILYTLYFNPYLHLRHRHASSLPSLCALDLGFCSGLSSAAVHAFAHERPALLRYNLRAASIVTAEVYNGVGQLMQARVSSTSPVDQRDMIENRRRPKRLARRGAEPFFYLKRSRNSADHQGTQ